MKPYWLLVMVLVTTAALGQDQDTDGPCSPAIRDVGGNVTINCIIAASAQERLEIAHANIDYVINKFESVAVSQSMVLLPAIEDYLADPKPEKWAMVRDHATLTIDLVKAAVRSAVISQPELEDELGDNLLRLLELAQSRGVMLYQLLGWDKSPEADQAAEWAWAYQELLDRLLFELHEVKGKLADPDAAAS